MYHYIFREIVPEDAVNEDGVTWARATDEQKAAGGFVKDQVKYDGRTYYMAARVTSWLQTGSDGKPYPEYGLNKTYYTDDTFTEADDSVKFIDFRNRYAPDTGSVEFTKVDSLNQPLAGATFTLYNDAACTKIAKDLGDPEQGIAGENQVITSGEDGKIVFDNMAAPRTYYMKETGVPNGYEIDDTIYKVIIEDSKDTTKTSKIIVNGDETETPITKIVNTKPGEISVIKKWVDQNGKEVDGAGRTATVQLRRYKYVVDESSGAAAKHNITINFHTEDYSGNKNTASKTESFTGDTVTVRWEVPGGANSGVFTGQDSSYWDEQIRSTFFTKAFDNVTSDITLDVELKEYWVVQDKGFSIDSFEIIESGSGPGLVLVEDENFPSSEDTEATKTLSADNGWAHTWSIGNDSGHDFPAGNENGNYLYYIVELNDEGNQIAIGECPSEDITLRGISYTPALIEEKGITEGQVTVTNEIEVIEPASITVTIKKVQEDDLGNESADFLPGATFRLEKYTTAEYNEKDPAWVEADHTISDKAGNAGTGTFEFEGLDAGFYKLVEVKTPAGYVKASEDPTFEIRANGSNELEVVFADDTEGVVHQLSENTYQFGNTPGAPLPHTGGRGTALLYLLGALLVMLAGAGLVVRRRKLV